jgi:hypothetical protein
MIRTLVLITTILMVAPSVAGPAKADLEIKVDQEMVGTLSEARVHFLTTVTKRKNDLAAYMGLRANMPAVLVTEDDDLYYIAAPPEELAALVGKTVKITGKLQPDSGLLKPSRLWVKTDGGWSEVKSGRRGDKP